MASQRTLLYGQRQAWNISRRSFMTLVLAGLISGCTSSQQSLSHPPSTPLPVRILSPSPAVTSLSKLSRITPENAPHLVSLEELHSDAKVRSVAWSPNSSMVAGGSVDIQVWDARSTKLLATLGSTGAGTLYGLDWSPGGSLIAAASLQGVQVWDVKRQKQRVFLPGHNRQPSCVQGECFGTLGVAWSPDGTRLASGNGDGAVQLWEVQTGRQLAVLMGPAYEVRSNDPNYPLGAVFGVAWSPDGERFASTRYDGIVQVWEAKTGKELSVLKYPVGNPSVNEVAYSPDGHLLASTNDDGTVRLWNLENNQTLRVLDDGDKYNFANAVSWSPDGRMLVTARGAGAASIWDVASGKQIIALPVTSSSFTEVWGAAWSPDGLRIASGDDNGMVQLWGVPQ